MTKQERLAEKMVVQLETMRPSGLLSYARAPVRNAGGITLDQVVQPAPVVVDVRSGKVVEEENENPLFRPPDWAFID